ncbi:oligosaccharide flippase family protein [Escherichia albertii]|uniref:oligosaccharide flippase family protein n=1 Tax=Escherichia albertii TaxID=208962 RepID=UPI001374A769|nr:oligosaccharide flippase family protein [Escherichia albertii]
MFRKMISHRVFKNSFALFIMQLFSYVSPLLVLPYLARLMSVENFGMLMMLYSLLAVCLVVTDFGFNLSGTYYISRNYKDKKKINEFLTSAFCIKALLSAVSVIYFWFFLKGEFQSLDGYSVLLIAITMFVQSFQPIWFFQGIEKMRHITLYTALSKLIYLLLVYFFVTSDSIVKVLLCYCISQAVGTIFSICFILKMEYSFSRTTYKNIISVFRQSIPFFVSRVAVVIYTSANTLFLGKYGGMVQAASYSSCEKIYFAGQGLLNPLSQAFFPYLSKNKDEKFYIKFVILSVCILSVVCVAASFFVYDVLNVFYGKKYNDSVGVLNTFLITTVIAYASVSFGYPMFTLIDKIGYVNHTVVIGALIHIIGLFILAKENIFTAQNIAYLVLIVETAVLITRIVMYAYLKIKRTQ